MKLRILFIAAMLLFLPACSWTFPWGHKPIDGGSAKPGTSAVVGNATTTANTAQSNLNDGLDKAGAQNASLLSKTKANITTAKEGNQSNPEGKGKQKVDQELSVADARLKDVKADEDELKAGRERNDLTDKGKLEEARNATAAAIEGAKKDAADLAVTKKENEHLAKERDDANLARDKAVNDYTTKAEQNKKDYDKKLDDRNQEVMRDQARTLNICGAVGLLLCALGLGFGGPVGLKMTWPFGVLGVLCFGLAQLVSQAWFMYACLGVLIIAIVIAVLWVLKHYKLGNLAEAAENKAANFKNILGTMVPVLDKAYDNAEQAGKDLLDKTVFAPLGDVMNRDEKSTIHHIRAESPTP